MSGPDGKCHGQLKTVLLASYPERLLLLPVLEAVPDRSRIVEHLKEAVVVIDGPMYHVGAACGIQVELVPATQRGGVAQHETVKQRGQPGDLTGQKRDIQNAVAAQQA